MTEWGKLYETKNWATYEVGTHSDDYKRLQSLLEESDLVCCGEESPMAADVWQREHSVGRLFFFDTEQILGMEVGTDVGYGVAAFGVLTGEWRGHSTGSLVLSVYSGVYKNPPTVTVGVATL